MLFVDGFDNCFPLFFKNYSFIVRNQYNNNNNVLSNNMLQSRQRLLPCVPHLPNIHAMSFFRSSYHHTSCLYFLISSNKRVLILFVDVFYNCFPHFSKLLHSLFATNIHLPNIYAMSLFRSSAETITAIPSNVITFVQSSEQDISVFILYHGAVTSQWDLSSMDETQVSKLYMTFRIFFVYTPSRRALDAS